MYPSAKVIGNDLSPIQPDFTAPNTEFVIEDFEDEWGYQDNYFDFIHGRTLSGYFFSRPRSVIDAMLSNQDLLRIGRNYFKKPISMWPVLLTCINSFFLMGTKQALEARWMA